MTTTFNSYHEYLDNSTHPYIKSQKQFEKEIKEKSEERIESKIFNGVFNGVDYVLPKRLKGTGIIMKVSILLAASNFNHQSKFIKCTAAVCAVSAAVFFYPQILSPLHSAWEPQLPYFTNINN